jgi:hypothetical protein
MHTQVAKWVKVVRDAVDEGCVLEEGEDEEGESDEDDEESGDDDEEDDDDDA